MKKLLHAAALLAFCLTSCQDPDFVLRHDANEIQNLDDQMQMSNVLKLPLRPQAYARDLPRYLQALGMQPAAIDPWKATLGRVIFYDKNLSKDRTTACASCHLQTHAFSDVEALSTGVFGRKGTRNAMPLANVASFSAYYTELNDKQPLLLWDNRASTVAEQSVMAFLEEHEMDITLEEVADRIRQSDYYAYYWKRAYGEFTVSPQQVTECLTAFVGAMGSANSRFDEALELAGGQIDFVSLDTVILQIYYGGNTTVITSGLPGFSSLENLGRDIFVDHCTSCHSPIHPLQEVLEACNGLQVEYQDQGKGALTGLPQDMGVFKSPSLRNIALTAPYMHDGRFQTLEEVVQFYNSDVANHPNLHPLLKPNGNRKLNLSAQEQNALVAFLKTLTDNSISQDDRFANPFK